MGNRRFSERCILFVAEGFGTGRFPVAPGTVGTLAGFAWIYLLLVPQNVLIYVGGIVLGFFVAVWLGGRGEQIAGLKDPGSIVIDEIAALPLAFLGAVLVNSQGTWTPGFLFYTQGKQALALVVAFAAFRFFDIRKPWIIARSQNLGGGWGLVVDDFLAAFCVLPITYLGSRFLF
jgi:phosphatidylglycerophosphatase A